MAYRNTLLVYEVFEAVGKATKREDKIKILRENDTVALRDVLQGMYDSRVSWLLPTGAPPPYEPADPRSMPANLLTQNRQFTYFVKGGKGDNINPLKRESIFIRLLESIHPKDAELLISMINRKAPAKTVTLKLIEEAFPNLIR
jgi:hypothetical protein